MARVAEGKVRWRDRGPSRTQRGHQAAAPLPLLLLLSACTTVSHPASAIPPGSGPSRPTPVGALAIVNGLLIDGTGADPIPDGVVVVAGNRIAAVGAAGDVEIPAEARVIDAMGGAILPGVINAHVHNSADPGTRRSTFLLQGVTSTCDMASPIASMPDFEEDADVGLSARGFHAGPILGPPGGYPEGRAGGFRLVYRVRTPEEARQAVANLISLGADYIKIALEPGFGDSEWPVLSAEQVCAIVEEAHGVDVLVRAHVAREDMVDVAIDCGVDVMEHIPVPLLSAEEWAIAAGGQRFVLPEDYESLLSRMVEAHVLMVPTLSVTPAVYDWYDIPAQYEDLAHELFLEPVRLFHDLGGVVALGNDFDYAGAEGGMPLAEMRLLEQAGLTPMEVIRAATGFGAMACGQGEDLGTLEPGRLADIIVADGDPLADISAMARVRIIILGGVLVLPERGEDM